MQIDDEKMKICGYASVKELHLNELRNAAS